MEAAAAHVRATLRPYNRVLVVADWRADTRAATRVVADRAAEATAVFGLVVPAWLHGLDWVGDPTASRPYAEHQVEALRSLWTARDLPLAWARAGDPDPVAAVEDALERWPADEVMLLTRTANPTPLHPLALARRIEHATGVATRRISLGKARAA